eukprot:2174890-Rhodomonas_salina.2
MSGKADEGDAELRNRAKGEGKEEAAATPDAADDSYEFAAVAPDADLPELRVEEGQDIDYRIILIFYLLGDLGCACCNFWTALACRCCAFVWCSLCQASPFVTLLERLRTVRRRGITAGARRNRC